MTQHSYLKKHISPGIHDYPLLCHYWLEDADHKKTKRSSWRANIQQVWAYFLLEPVLTIYYEVGRADKADKEDKAGGGETSCQPEKKRPWQSDWFAME